MFFNAVNNNDLEVVQRSNRKLRNKSVNFNGVDKYNVMRSNFHNDIIQTSLKSGNKRILGFIDAKETIYPTETFVIGNWTLSDISLRDNDTVFAVKVEDNRIYQSSISMNEPRVYWKLMNYTTNRIIETIEIEGNYIQGSDGGRSFNISLNDSYNSSSLIQCSATSYLDSTGNTCLPCHDDCNACVGPSENDCTSCPQHWFMSTHSKNEKTFKCVETCSSSTTSLEGKLYEFCLINLPSTTSSSNISFLNRVWNDNYRIIIGIFIGIVIVIGILLFILHKIFILCKKHIPSEKKTDSKLLQDETTSGVVNEE